MRYAFLFLLAAACKPNVVNNYYLSDTDDAAVGDTDPADTDMSDTDADSGAYDTDAVDTDQAVDVPDVLNLSFVTAFGPTGYVTAQPGARVNLGGIAFRNDGDDDIEVSELNLPLMGDDSADNVPNFTQAAWHQFFTDCALERWPNGTTLVGPSDQRPADAHFMSRIAWSDSFTVPAGDEIVANLVCTAPSAVSANYLAFAFELPFNVQGEGMQIVTDADQITYGDFNGNPPTRATVLPYDPYLSCAHDVSTVDGQQITTSIDPRVVWTTSPYDIMFDQDMDSVFTISANGCSPDFDVEWVQPSLREFATDRAFMPDGQSGSMFASWTVNGSSVNAYGQTLFGNNYYYNEQDSDHTSYVAWALSSPVVGSGLPTGLMPTHGSASFGFKVDASSFQYLANVGDSSSAFVQMEVSAKIRDPHSGAVWYLNTSQTGFTILFQ